MSDSGAVTPLEGVGLKGRALHVTAYHKKSAGVVVGTPASVFEPLDEEFGFTVDVCALPENAKCARFFDPLTNGLLQDWSDEVCWMNPPYGNEIREWMRKARREALRGATVVCLVPSRTDTAWWHEDAMLATEIRFIRGRITFEGMAAPAPFPCALVIFRPLKARIYSAESAPKTGLLAEVTHV